MKKGIPCFAFVFEQTWNERHAYKKALKKSKKNKTAFDNKYVCKYVESVDTIDFVETLQGAYNKFGRSNWIDQYVSKDEIVDKVAGKLRGLTRYLLEGLVKAQTQNLEKRQTSTSLSLTLGDVFQRGYYLEPDCKIESGVLTRERTIHKRMNSALTSGKSVLILGEAGYGKTTVLAKSFIEHADSFLSADSYSVPLYLWLKKKTQDYHFNFESYIQESFVEELGVSAYPFLDLRLINPYFYFDGFDEISEKMNAETIERIRQQRQDKISFAHLRWCRRCRHRE